MYKNLVSLCWNIYYYFISVTTLQIQLLPQLRLSHWMHFPCSEIPRRLSDMESNDFLATNVVTVDGWMGGFFFCLSFVGKQKTFPFSEDYISFGMQIYSSAQVYGHHIHHTLRIYWLCCTYICIVYANGIKPMNGLQGILSSINVAVFEEIMSNPE